MSSKGRKEKDKDDVATHEPQGFAELCERMMSAPTAEGCGIQMQEIMSRCMARFRGEQKEPRQSGETRRRSR
jgi:hypothetical protein